MVDGLTSGIKHRQPDPAEVATEAGGLHDVGHVEDAPEQLAAWLLQLSRASITVALEPHRKDFVSEL